MPYAARLFGIRLIRPKAAARYATGIHLAAISATLRRMTADCPGRGAMIADADEICGSVFIHDHGCHELGWLDHQYRATQLARNRLGGAFDDQTR